MLQENKGMATSTHSIRPGAQDTHISLGVGNAECDKNTQSITTTKSAARKLKRYPWTLLLRVPYMSNTLIAITGEKRIFHQSFYTYL